MHTVNTHDSLMGQNPFVANSNIKTVNDFNRALDSIINSIILANEDFVTDYGIDENDEPNTVLSSFIDFMRDEELDIPELNNVRNAMDDFDGVNTIDVDDMAGVLGAEDETSKIVSLDDEFAFMYNLSSVGDGALCLVV